MDFGFLAGSFEALGAAWLSGVEGAALHFYGS